MIDLSVKMKGKAMDLYVTAKKYLRASKQYSGEAVYSPVVEVRRVKKATS